WIARSMTSSAWCGLPIGNRIRTNIPGDRSRPVPTERRGGAAFGIRAYGCRVLRGVLETPRIEMQTVPGVAWVLHKMITPLGGKAVAPGMAIDTGMSPVEVYATICPDAIALRTWISVRSSMSK